MKKKFMAVLACAAIACFGAFALTGCGGEKAPSAEGLLPDDTLVVGFDAEFPPYGYLASDGEEGFEAADGNTYTGFDLELANEACNRMGLTLKVEPIDWDSKDALLGSGAISCIWNGFTYEGREDQYAFTTPYMVNAQVIVTKADSDIKTLADLEGKIVITQKGSAALTALEEDNAELAATFKELQTIADYNNAFMQLESGAVDAVACDLAQAAYHMAVDEGKFAQLEETLQAEHFAAGFALGNEDIAAAFTETLKAMDADGFCKELCEKYADQGMDYALWCLE